MSRMKEIYTAIEDLYCEGLADDEIADYLGIPLELVCDTLDSIEEEVYREDMAAGVAFG